MNRTAMPAISILLVVFGALASEAADPLAFLVTFTPDSQRIVMASHLGGIRVLSVPDLKELRSFKPEGDRRLRSVAVSANGRWIAADDDVGDLLIWNLESGAAMPAVPVTHQTYPVYVFHSVDDTLFLYQKTLRVWDVKQGRELGVIKDLDNIRRMTISPDGSDLVVLGTCKVGDVSGDVCTYSLSHGTVVAAANWEEFCPARSALPHTNSPITAAFSNPMTSVSSRRHLRRTRRRGSTREFGRCPLSSWRP
jgi:WD40 repeat protein